MWSPKRASLKGLKNPRRILRELILMIVEGDFSISAILSVYWDYTLLLFVNWILKTTFEYE